MPIPAYPNRIREIRVARKLSAEKLGQLCGTSQQQIQRLETGDRRLTQDWMERIAKALRIAPADLLPTARQFGIDDVVEADLGVPAVSAAMAARGLHVYRVATDGLSALAIEREQVITIDQSPDALSRIKTGDVALLAVRSGETTIHVLRQYVAPRVYLTHPRTGAVGVLLADDSVLTPVLVGVMIQDAQ